MRALSPQFAASLQGGATTLCHCWRLMPRNGSALGFTDHDRDLNIDGFTYSATSGLDAGAMESKLGFAIGGGEVTGALASAAMSEADLASGRYDGATLEIWRVDWMNPDARLLLDIGTIGEVKRSEFAFTAEVRSIAHEFDMPHGRLYQAGCSANLGDAKCGVDLTSSTYRASGLVLQSDGRIEVVVSVDGYNDGWFTGGTLEFTSGANTGESKAIKSYSQLGTGAAISLWAPLGGVISLGDSAVLTAGCDKAFDTCRAKFSNQSNFRGFPHMPGNDVLMSYPNAGDVNMDGGSLFR